MPLTVSILKNTRRQAVVKFVGAGSNSITLANILYSNATIANTMPGIADANTIDQTLVVNDAVCTINDVIYSVTGETRIVRNGQPIIYLAAGQDSFSLSQYHGATFSEFANTSITVETGSANGTVILCLTKGQGFDDPDRQTLEAYER